MPDRISIPALHKDERLDYPQEWPTDNPVYVIHRNELMALVEAVEAAYKPETGCAVCGTWLQGHAPDCPGARFDFGGDDD